MPWHDIIWTDRALEKIAAHGVTQEEVEDVVLAAKAVGRSTSTGLPIYAGWTRSRRRLVVVFRWADIQRIVIEIITAYEPERH